ncbi:hypothetical protein NQ315_002463, partial [Exocentrus adspersus]
QIEGILNSRPLISLSDDLDELEALTPGHFIIGTAMCALPQPISTKPMSLLKRYHLLQAIVQRFWAKWSSDYLNSLQQRGKWAQRGAVSDEQVGALVLLKEDNTAPQQWPLGRIVQLHPGSDGVVRVVTVKTPRGEYFSKDNTESSLAEDTSLVTEDDVASEEIQTEGEFSEEKRNDKIMKGQEIKQRKKKAKTMSDTEVDRALIKALANSEPKYELPPDEDELFFKSLLPIVRTMNMDEKLKFRMEILSIVQKIRQEKLNQHHYPPPLPSPQPSLHSVSTHSNYDSSSPQYVYPSISGYPQQTYTQLRGPNDFLE